MLPVQTTYPKRDQDGNEMKDADGNPIKEASAPLSTARSSMSRTSRASPKKPRPSFRRDPPGVETDSLEPTARLEGAERVLGAWSVPTTWAGNNAFYSPSEDRITMPPVDQFNTSEGMYAPAHEQVHSTGHKSRLDRKMVVVLTPSPTPGKNLLLN